MRYLGETSRSMAERNLEHWDDAANSDANSHMRVHFQQHHPEQLSKEYSRCVLPTLKVEGPKVREPQLPEPANHQALTEQEEGAALRSLKTLVKKRARETRDDMSREGKKIRLTRNPFYKPCTDLSVTPQVIQEVQQQQQPEEQNRGSGATCRG